MAVTLDLIKKLAGLLLATFFTYVFVFSGLTVSVLSILLLVLWPLSTSAYRWITSGLAYTVLGRKLNGAVHVCGFTTDCLLGLCRDCVGMY